MHKISLSRSECVRVGRTVFVDEIVDETFAGILFDLMQRHGVQDRLDQTAVIGEAHDFVRTHPDVDVFLLPD